MAEKKVKETKAKNEKVKEVLISEVDDQTTTDQDVKKTSDKDLTKTSTSGEVLKFSGKYIKAIGRRKRSTAQVRLYQDGKGLIVVNGLKISEYFPGEGANLITRPLKVTGHGRDFNFSVLVHGGGKEGQIGAVRLGISRALLILDPESKEALKVNGFLTRDPRQVERKKPGLRKARKAPQWSKR